ncbi:hypothetical protein AUQ37_09190 [Candidatus Methanomethylophilus sp. 1R26]|nr:hypothetical protein AUQ37_09190 [Candidatus Methanomethylophilus sp. 1R26]TQS76785.1 MAG: hypothetical protein A3Q59_02630 [Methanomethylophilus alvi]
MTVKLTKFEGGRIVDALLVLAIVFLITQLVAAAVLLAYRKEHGERPGDAKAYFDVGIRARMAASIPALVLVICWLGAFVLSDGELHDDLGSPTYVLGIVLIAMEIPTVILYIPSIRRL